MLHDESFGNQKLAMTFDNLHFFNVPRLLARSQRFFI